MAEYASAAGFVQFDVNEKEVNGQDIREFVIRTIGSQKLLKVTLWPEWKDVPVEKGDFVAVDGKYEQSLGQAADGTPREYLSITAYYLVVTPGEQKAEREVVTKSAAKAKAATSDEPLF